MAIPISGRRLCGIALCAFAFALPLSLPVAEFLLFFALLVGIVQQIRGERMFAFRSGLLVPVVLFAVVALLGIIFSSRPAVSFGKVHRLLFLLLVFQIPAVFTYSERLSLSSLVASFMAGVCCKAVYDIIRIPLHAIRGGYLYDAGSMTGPQFYMVAICILIAISSQGLVGMDSLLKRWRYIYSPALALSIVGLILHFKRGAWLACSVSVGVFLFIKRRWGVIVALIACASALLLVPQVRTRIMQIPQVFTDEQGGRWVLWTEVAPALISENPWGVGWHAVQHEDFLEYADYVQPKLDHLHNNILQIALELGFIGMAVWLIWMFWTLLFMLDLHRKLRAVADRNSELVLGCLLAFIALHLNGLVENNFDDSEIMLLYFLLMGIAGSLKLGYKEGIL